MRKGQRHLFSDQVFHIFVITRENYWQASIDDTTSFNKHPFSGSKLRIFIRKTTVTSNWIKLTTNLSLNSIASQIKHQFLNYWDIIHIEIHNLHSTPQISRSNKHNKWFPTSHICYTQTIKNKH